METVYRVQPMECRKSSGVTPYSVIFCVQVLALQYFAGDRSYQKLASPCRPIFYGERYQKTEIGYIPRFEQSRSGRRGLGAHAHSALLKLLASFRGTVEAGLDSREPALSLSKSACRYVS
jgi:hypothetical protein